MSIILILLIIIALIFAPWIIYFKFTDDIESDTDENQKNRKNYDAEIL